VSLHPFLHKNVRRFETQNNKKKQRKECRGSLKNEVFLKKEPCVEQKYEVIKA